MTRTLDDFLKEHAARGATEAAVAGVVAAVAAGCARLEAVIAVGDYEDHPPADPEINASGDVQKRLDAIADEILLDAVRQSPCAAYASEEQEGAVLLNAGAPVLVAIDPLDGSSNIDTNLSIGTIFSILPMIGGDAEASLRQAGTAQLAAGFVIYGPRTAIVLSLGRGTSIFVLDPASRVFTAIREDVVIPKGMAEYAINSSNYRHWDDHVRAYIDDCVAGAEGPLAFDFNMRWGASLVAEAYRIFQRGGVFLYPANSREKYSKGRLRLLYEAFPIAFIVEQAGGAATTGQYRILDLVARDVHERTPLVFGSTDHVERIAHYYNDLTPAGNRSPLFGHRGLLRA